MFQTLAALLIYMALVVPVGIYLYRVATRQKTFVDPVSGRADNRIYKVCYTERGNMSWKTYALNLPTTNMVMILIGYLVLRPQGLLFLNPNKIGTMESILSYNTIISFMANMSLQHYSGESGLTYLSRMVVIMFMIFTSAATGCAVCTTFYRGMSGRPMGNFCEDMVRNTTYISIPIAFIAGLILIWQGTPQNFQSSFTVCTMEGKLQGVVTGPIAALESIKHVGINGGGSPEANSFTSLENPTIISSIAELYSMMILSGACVITLSRMIADKRKELGKKTIFGKQGRTVFTAMATIFMAGLTACYISKEVGDPIPMGMDLNQDMGSYEGKKAQFGIAQSALFAITTTSFTIRTVNNIHDTLTPLEGLAPLLHMTFDCAFGGKDVGLMNMITYAILAVLTSSLMIGRTPKYPGEKIEGREIKLVVVCLIIHPLLILGFSALAVFTVGGPEGVTNPGLHGLSQVLYKYSSSTANNGSGFEGLVDNSVSWNMTTGLAMYFERFPAIILQLTITGNILTKRKVNETIGILRTDNVIFTLILMFVVYIFAALTFFPALTLRSAAKHLTI